jgi:16S rRNA (cytosine967-C5)-methyltransferase
MTAVHAVSPARRAAFQILLRVDRSSAHADDLLRGKAVSALAPADRHLATALVLGVLRWRLWLDGQVRPLLQRPGAKLEPEVQTALRLGALQLLLLDRIPAHAALDESVEVVKQAGHRFASGMVNAVLRKLAREKQENVSSSDAAAREAHPQWIREAHPEWMVARWIAHYGEQATHAICLHGQTQPEPVVRVENREVEEELLRSGIELAPAALLACSRLITAGDVTATEAFRADRVQMQDEGSQLIAELAACCAEPANTVLDACAAPGGKTRILAERMPQARIVALEASADRLAVLRERLAVLSDRVDCRLADAATFEEPAVFDLALVDAPCSGTGTLGRNPEIRHRLKPEDIRRHAERQKAILRAALRAVRPGGFVAYSTCSLEPEENEQVVAAELNDARQVTLAARIELLAEQGILRKAGAEKLRTCLTPEGALRLMPGMLHTDGFYVALIEKLS